MSYVGYIEMENMRQKDVCQVKLKNTLLQLSKTGRYNASIKKIC